MIVSSQDPVFAAIEAHRLAYAAYDKAVPTKKTTRRFPIWRDPAARWCRPSSKTLAA